MSTKQANKLYTKEQIYKLDEIAIKHHNLSSIELMKLAAKSVFEYILEKYPKQQINVFCGSGNNAGDGYIIASLAKQKGIPVQIIYTTNPNKLSQDAKLAYEIAKKESVVIKEFNFNIKITKGIVVDAILGIGIKGVPKNNHYNAIKFINKSKLSVISVDIPSGLNPDTGRTEGVCVKANTTISFIALKQGLFTCDGPDYCGNIIYKKLNIDSIVFKKVNHYVIKTELNELMKFFKDRRKNSHKNNYGHVLLIGGDYGYAGAILLAAEAALRSGAGLVSVATRKENINAILARKPEIMAHSIDCEEQHLDKLIDKANVLVIGPGLGNSSWSKNILKKSLESNLDKILDADALNIIANNNIKIKNNSLNILTPHPKEAARLLKKQTYEIQDNRFQAIKEITKKYKSQVLLKGAGSLTLNSEKSIINICTAGNTAMATAGMGDVLSGIIGALLAQGVEKDKCLHLAVCLHSSAADLAANNSQRGIISSDVIDNLKFLIG